MYATSDVTLNMQSSSECISIISSALCICSTKFIQHPFPPNIPLNLMLVVLCCVFVFCMSFVYACMLVIVTQCQFCQATSYTMLFPSNVTDVTHTSARCNLTTSSSCLRSASFQCRLKFCDFHVTSASACDCAVSESLSGLECRTSASCESFILNRAEKRSARRHFISNCCSVLVESRKRNKNKYFFTWRHLQLLVDKSLISWWIWCVFRGRIWHSVKTMYLLDRFARFCHREAHEWSDSFRFLSYLAAQSLCFMFYRSDDVTSRSLAFDFSSSSWSSRVLLVYQCSMHIALDEQSLPLCLKFKSFRPFVHVFLLFF